MSVSITPRKFGFADFTLDPRAKELLRNGIRMKLPGQPFAVLAMLLERQGEVVTREELRAQLWPKERFVDFDHSINVAVNKIREVLEDSSEQPRFIETIPRTGYRFIGPITAPAEKEEPGLKGGSAGATEAEAEQVGAGTKRQTRWSVVLAAGVAAVALGLTGYLYFHRPPKLTNRDTIVLADFANTTGDPVFDGTLRQGLAVQLEQSPFLSLISGERIHQVLRLMGQPADVRLTPEIAREVCERTASAAVLEGSIAALGTQYVLGLRAENCRTGDELADEQVQVAKKEDVLKALGQIATDFRSQVGESLATIKKYDIPLAEATTASLEALKVYSAGWQVTFSSGSAASVPFFRRAIEIDPNFASAYVALGRMYGDIGESRLSALNTNTAYQLRGRASEQERFFISLTYDLQVTGNLEKGRQTCAMWAQAYPRAWIPHGLLSGNIYPSTGKREESIEEANIAIDLNPGFAFGYINLAVAYLALERRDEADAALRRALERKLEIPDLFVLRYVIASLNGDKDEMERELALGRGKPGAEDWMANAEGFVLAYSGRLQAAREMSELAADLARKTERPDTQALYEADAAVREALFGNDSIATRKVATALELSNSRDVAFEAGIALALAGDSARSQVVMEDLSKRFPEDTRVQFTYAPTLRGLLALNQGRPSKAIEQLHTAIPYELGTPTEGGSEFLLGAGNLYSAYVRGRGYLAENRGEEAAREFQKILDHRGIVLNDPVGSLAHLQLGRARALFGDKAKARSAYQDFFALWKDADPDIPVLKQAMAEYKKLR